MGRTSCASSQCPRARCARVVAWVRVCVWGKLDRKGKFPMLRWCWGTSKWLQLNRKEKKTVGIECHAGHQKVARKWREGNWHKPTRFPYFGTSATLPPRHTCLSTAGGPVAAP